MVMGRKASHFLCPLELDYVDIQQNMFLAINSLFFIDNVTNNEIFMYEEFMSQHM